MPNFGAMAAAKKAGGAGGWKPPSSATGGNKMVQLERCKGTCCPFSNYCMRHILNDKKQKLYGACQYLLVNDQTNQIPCRTPSYRPFGKNEVRGSGKRW